MEEKQINDRTSVDKLFGGCFYACTGFKHPTKEYDVYNKTK